MGLLTDYTLWMTFVFIIGYLLITLESIIKINKATIALLIAVICWALQFVNRGVSESTNLSFLCYHLSNISQVVFFLLGALTVVEVINAHKGFQFLANFISFRSKRKLLWVIGFITFFLSAILDNLTTTIVMITLLSRLVEESEDRLIIGGGIVIAANCGGAWTPIGDVTTTMLWIGEQLSTFSIIQDLFVPSLVCMIVSLTVLSFMLKGNFQAKQMHLNDKYVEPRGQLIFFLGLGCLMFVPIFKVLTGLPPFMGMLLGLSVLWLVTDIIHSRYEERSHLRVHYALTKIDLSSALFFLGILLCVNALETAKILESVSIWFDNSIGNVTGIATLMGFASAIIDNVPLVAAMMGMYDLERYPTDHQFWQLIAYCAGTGGSILIIGSAAGVVFMGLEKVDFFWYFKKISLAATIGYLAGIGVYLIFQ